MQHFLIVGLPGAGKSTVLQEIARQGYTCIDADDDPLLSAWRNRQNGSFVEHRDISRTDWNDTYDWAWKENRLQQLLLMPRRKNVFFAGNAVNVSDFYAYFTKVFALVLNDTELSAHLDGRAKGYGSTPDERGRILAWNKTFVETERQRGAILIPGHSPVKHLAAEIVKRSHES